MPAFTVTTPPPDTNPAGALIFAAVVATLCYFLGCWIWPFVPCRKCSGTGRLYSPFGRAFRLCRRCSGTRRKIRVGRRIINAVFDLGDKGTR